VPLVDPILAEILKDQIEENRPTSQPIDGMGLTPCGHRSRVNSTTPSTARARSQGYESETPHREPRRPSHTFATRYLTGGGDIFICSQLLGHAGVEVTQRVYVHLKPADLAHRSKHVKLGIANKTGSASGKVLHGAFAKRSAPKRRQ
jgi:integrase